MKKLEKQNISGSSNSSIGKRNRRRGNNYERKIVNELKEITKNENICTSRSESKRLDDAKIDIADPDGVLPFYVQIKCTQAIPQVKRITAEVGKKDLPTIIVWNAQEAKEKKQVSVGEYVILPKDLFYDLLKNLY